MAGEGFTFGSFSSLTGIGPSAGIPPWTLPKWRLGRVDFSERNAPAPFTPVAGLTLKVADPVTGHIPLFAVNDLLRMKAFNGAAVLDNWLRVDSVTDPGSGLGYFQYGCTLMSGTPGTFPKGTAVVNYGQAGQGFILLTSDADFSPYIDIATHAGQPWASVTPRVRLGNLDGVLGLAQQWGIALGFDLTDVTAGARYIVASDQQVALYNVDLALYNGANQSVELTNAGRLKIGTNISGAATTQLYYNPAAATYNGEALGAGTLLLGDNSASKANLVVTATDMRFRFATTTQVLIDGTSVIVGEVGAGKSNVQITAGAVKLRSNTTDKIVLDTAGNATLTGDLIMSTAGIIRANATAILTGNGYWLDFNAGTPRFRIGTITGGALDEGIYWDGANIQIYSGTGSFGSPTTGLKIYTNATIGMFEAWGGGVKQVYMGTDGILYAGAGSMTVDVNGIWLAATETAGSAPVNPSTAQQVKFGGTAAAPRGWIGGHENNQTGTYTDYITLFSKAKVGATHGVGIIRLMVENDDASVKANLQVISNIGVTISGETRLDGALNIGTSITGGSNGQVHAAGLITGDVGATINGALLWTTDNNSDIGASSATRPRNLYLGTSIKQSTALGARAYNSAAFVHNSTGNWLAVTLDSELFDNDTIHSTSSNTSRLTAITAGVYVIAADIEWAANATGIRGIAIRLNGATFIAEQTMLASATASANLMTITTIYNLAANDYIEMMAYQNSGGNLNVARNANVSPEFAMVRIA